MKPLPSFTAQDKPPDIVAGAGSWLADALGWSYLRSKRAIVRKSPGRVESIYLEPSTWSRAGQGAWVMPRLTITDDRVRRWKAAKPLTGLFSRGGDIFNSLLINLGIPDVELLGPLRLQQPDLWLSLEDFAGILREVVLPNVSIHGAGPAVAAERLPARWIVFPEPPFWWASAYDDRGAAKRFLARYFEANPSYRQHFEKGRARASSDAGPPFGNTLVAFGCSAVRSGALNADEPV